MVQFQIKLIKNCLGLDFLLKVVAYDIFTLLFPFLQVSASDVRAMSPLSPVRKSGPVPVLAPASRQQ